MYFLKSSQLSLKCDTIKINIRLGSIIFFQHKSIQIYIFLLYTQLLKPHEMNSRNTCGSCVAC